MANAYYLLENFEGCMRHYKRAIELNPSKPETFYNFGNALCKMQEYELAIEQYRKALELDENQANAYYNLGNAQYVLERNQESIDSYKRALAIKDSSECHFNIAVNYNDMNDLENAAHHYE